MIPIFRVDDEEELETAMAMTFERGINQRFRSVQDPEIYFRPRESKHWEILKIYKRTGLFWLLYKRGKIN